ncbi:hypothetical protein FA13DRAFT_1781010 [Coprinellus micaceus]|uniref:Uncharacterized protein n=1 Tax=Coprinellus micaceus TaxID=71717 RepID=A0A4Y7SBR3_COPMI|nr:hypothetical protein FA13DRAFT_1781010 [Coprinellus micaceus]
MEGAPCTRVRVSRPWTRGRKREQIHGKNAGRGERANHGEHARRGERVNRGEHAGRGDEQITANTPGGGGREAEQNYTMARRGQGKNLSSEFRGDRIGG